MDGHVFISYSRADRAYVERLAAFLDKSGISVWYDYRIVVGEAFDEVIERQIQACGAFLVVVTPDAVDSTWVRREIVYADAEQKAILPLLLRQVDRVPIRLVGLQLEDVTDVELPEAGFVERLRDVIAHGRRHIDASLIEPRTVWAQPTSAEPARTSVDEGSLRAGAPEAGHRWINPSDVENDWAGGPDGHVLISHAAIDAPYVVSLRAHLIAAGLTVCTSDGGSSGARVAEMLLSNCAALVPVVSHRSSKESRLLAEIDMAIKLEKPVLPVKLEQVTVLGLGEAAAEDVDGGRLPSEFFLDRLRVLTGVFSERRTLQPGPRRGTVYQPNDGAGRVIAWGYSDHGQTSVPPELDDAIAIASGEEHCLALRTNGRVVAWGANGYGQSTVPADLDDVIAIAAGNWHSLALRRGGQVVTWGENGASQARAPRSLPDVVAIAAGHGISLAVGDDGVVTVWGHTARRPKPFGLQRRHVISVAAGTSHCLDLDRGGYVTGWGSNDAGQASVPGWVRDVAAIAAGDRHSVALRRDGRVLSWGGNDAGQADVPIWLGDVVAISAGLRHTLALHRDGHVIAWGSNDLGQTDIPTGLASVSAIAAGDSFNLAIVSAGYWATPS